jgi:hypothetical protein
MLVRVGDVGKKNTIVTARALHKKYFESDKPAAAYMSMQPGRAASWSIARQVCNILSIIKLAR